MALMRQLIRKFANIRQSPRVVLFSVDNHDFTNTSYYYDRRRDGLRRLKFRSVHGGHEFLQSRLYSSDPKKDGPIKLPKDSDHKNVWEVLMTDFGTNAKYRADIPSQSDVVIVGGGIIGLSCAYWLKQRNPEGISVTVIEQDPMYTSASTVLSFGGIRSQFSLPENVQMSLFGCKFLREIKEHLSVIDMDPPDVQFCPNGYLVLAKSADADSMIAHNKMQRELGANVVLLSKGKLKDRWPWLNVDDVELGSFGVENEGWFDPWSYLMAFKHKARSLGVNIIQGKVVGVDFSIDRRVMSESEFVDVKILQYINVLTPDNYIRPIRFAYCVNAAGSAAGQFASMVGVGTGSELLSVPLPVEKRKRYVYVVHAPNGPGIKSPMVVDTSSTCVRREGLGGMYLVYGTPGAEGEPTTDDLNVDHDFFDNKLWPELAHRVPSMQDLKVMNAWSGFYDYNYVDQNLIIGPHPYFKNLFFANGSSGHGLQHAAAIGRAVQELIVDGRYTNIDLSRLSFERMVVDEPLMETFII